MPEGYMTLREAEEYLGVSHMKIWRLVKDGVLTTVPNPLDTRSKLVNREDVEQLRTVSKPAPKIEKKEN